ncbi:hypothetical protein SLS55_001562 [Diplodia seriata]|uniref:Uncharacterized protein n=1 Tax=Diplodia seriata TaxID=420778 RepID=A0ABR3CPV2_9PEZI
MTSVRDASESEGNNESVNVSINDSVSNVSVNNDVKPDNSDSDRGKSDGSEADDSEADCIESKEALSDRELDEVDDSRSDDSVTDSDTEDSGLEGGLGMRLLSMVGMIRMTEVELEETLSEFPEDSKILEAISEDDGKNVESDGPIPILNVMPIRSDGVSDDEASPGVLEDTAVGAVIVEGSEVVSELGAVSQNMSLVMSPSDGNES